MDAEPANHEEGRDCQPAASATRVKAKKFDYSRQAYFPGQHLAQEFDRIVKAFV
jgi:hypothetical protein